MNESNELESEIGQSTDEISKEELLHLQRGLIQLSVSFQLSTIGKSLWKGWNKKVMEWSSSPKKEISTEEQSIVRDILKSIATDASLSNLLENPEMTIAYLLRSVGYLSLDVRELRTKVLNPSIKKAVISVASQKESDLTLYDWIMKTTEKSEQSRVLSLARKLQSIGDGNTARDVVRDLLLKDGDEESRNHSMILMELSDYEVGDMEVSEKMSVEKKRTLAKRVFESKGAEDSVSFARCLSVGMELRDIESVKVACQLILNSKDISDEDAMCLIARIANESSEGTMTKVDNVTEKDIEVNQNGTKSEAMELSDTSIGDSPKTDESLLKPYECEIMDDDDQEITGLFLSDDELDLVEPSGKLTSDDIREILKRHRKRKDNQELSKTSLDQYTSDLVSIPSDIFPWDADRTLDWLEETKTQTTANKIISRITVFVHCFEGHKEEQTKYFGTEKQYEYAKSVFHEKQRVATEEELRKKPDKIAEWKAKDENLRVSLQQLEDNYEAKVKSAVRKMMDGSEPVDRWKLQDCFLIELYQERPPTRSKEYWMLQYEPEVITEETNYVSGDRLVIQVDKVSETKGTYIYDLTDILRQTLEMLIAEHKRAGIMSGYVFQKRDGSQMSRSGFRKATYRAFEWLVGKGLGCRILRKIVQSGMTERGELKWPEQRREFMRRSRVELSTADRHYIIRVSTPQEEEGGAPSKLGEGSKTLDNNDSVREERLSSERVQSAESHQTGRKRSRVEDESPRNGKWGRANWKQKGVQEWFKERIGEYQQLRAGEWVQDWIQMSEDMNKKFGTEFTPEQLRHRKMNLRKQGKWEETERSEAGNEVGTK